MTTTELNPAFVSYDPSSLTQSEPPKLEKTCDTLTPGPNTHAASDKRGLLTSVVDNLTLEDAAVAKPQRHDRKDTSSGEHGADDRHSPPSPRERLGRSPIPTGNLKDPARLDAAVDLSDLTKLTPNSTPKVDERLPPTAEIGGQGPSTMASQRPGETTTRPQERVDDPFSLSGLPSLQMFIPHSLFPDELLVHDPHNITKLRRHKSQSTSSVPVRYVRVFPNFKAPHDPVLPYKLRFNTDLKAARDHSMPPHPAFSNRSPNEPLHVAHLYLKNDNRLGTGHHSSVYSAPLRLRLNEASEQESTVRVAVKTASGSCGAHKMLHLEAGVYDGFPRHFMDDQYYVTRSAGTPTLVSPGSFGSNTADDRGAVAARWVEPAVVPKFYGYYAAVGPDGSVIMPMHERCGIDATCSVSWPTRILLVEECGKPVFPELLSHEQKVHCLQLVTRLHAAGFAQNSMFVRNVLVQPGPLSAPPAARSYTTPSFRLIDFGRGVVLSHLPPGSERLFSQVCQAEEWWAVHTVLELCRAGTKGSPCAVRFDKVLHTGLDTMLCGMYERVMSLHWSGQERRRVKYKGV